MSNKFIKNKVKRKFFFSLDAIFGTVSIIFSIGVSIIFILMASIREFSSLENTFFQIFITALAVGGSFLWGRKISQIYSNKTIKGYARPAFRRASFLFFSLIRLNNNIKEEIQTNKNQNSLEKFQASVIEQIYISLDALEDWRDIIPEDVKEIEQSMEKRRKSLEEGV